MENCPGICEVCPINQGGASRQKVLIEKRDAFNEAAENNTCALGPKDLTFEESKLVTACLNRQNRSGRARRQCNLSSVAAEQVPVS